MKISFHSKAFDDFNDWADVDKKIHKRIKELIKAIRRDPYSGEGKPEQLKHGLSGYWSRRINREHRLVYKVEDDVLHIASCKHHY